MIQEKARFVVGFVGVFWARGLFSKPWDEWIFCWCLLGVLGGPQVWPSVDDVVFFRCKSLYVDIKLFRNNTSNA